MALILSLLYILMLSGNSMCDIEKEEKKAAKWLEIIMPEYIEIASKRNYARFNFLTNITDENNKIYTEVNLEFSTFRDQELFKQKSSLPWKQFKNETLKDMFYKMGNAGINILQEDKYLTYISGIQALSEIYRNVTVCNRPGESSSKCYKFKELHGIMKSSNDVNELLWAWKGFSDALGGKTMKPLYLSLVPLLNEAAERNGYNDYTEVWLDRLYDQDFEKRAESALEDLKVLYEQLHAYVRRKLKDHFPTVKFPEEGHIPAHLLKHLNGMRWDYLEDIARPFDGKSYMDTTDEMKCQGYNMTGIAVMADNFFKSMNLIPLPKAFWDHSLFEKPTDRQIRCRDDVYDFYNTSDYRITTCSKVDEGSLILIHSLIGQVQYRMQYSNQPATYRKFAHDGFDTAVSRTLKLYSGSPTYLQEMGLLPNYVQDAEADLNVLMKKALELIVFLPYSFVVDKYRFRILKEKIPTVKLNENWWKLSCKYRGISPPVARSETNFDAAAEYHFLLNNFYYVYLSGWIITYQMYKHLCDISGYKGPLHLCTIYKSRKAGEKLAEFMKLGCSKDIKYAMKVATGREEMSLEPMVEYFQPLLDWLQEQNKGHPVGWTDNCPNN